MGHGGHGIWRPTRDVGGLVEGVVEGVSQPEHLALFVSESIEGFAQVSEVRTVTQRCVGGRCIVIANVNFDRASSPFASIIKDAISCDSECPWSKLSGRPSELFQITNELQHRFTEHVIWRFGTKSCNVRTKFAGKHVVGIGPCGIAATPHGVEQLSVKL